MKNIHPVFVEILNDFTAKATIPDTSFIKADYCGECGGEGFIKSVAFKAEEFTEYETEQCEECERLHKAELRADLMHDMAKGN